MTVRIVLVDDQELVRAGLALLAARDGDIEIVGEAGDGLEGLAVVRRARPDVVLMDLRMPLVDGIAATEQISRDRELGDVRVLVLTTFDAEEDVLAAVRAGASGYLLKDVDGPGLRQAIRDVASGDSIADPSLTRILFRQASRSAHRPEMVAGLRRAGDGGARRSGTWVHECGDRSDAVPQPGDDPDVCEPDAREAGGTGSGAARGPRVRIGTRDAGRVSAGRCASA